MPAALLSLTSPAPAGFAYEPQPKTSRLRRGAFCLYAAEPGLADALIAPLADKVFGLVVVPGDAWAWRPLGPFCYRWSVPAASVPSLAGIAGPYLELIERAHDYDDRAKAQEWETQRAAQDRLFLSRVQLEFRDAMLTADRNLRATHRYLNELIEFLPDATLVLDRDRKVVAWNRAMESLSGVGKGAMVGKGDFEYAIPFYGERRPILVDLLFLPPARIPARYDVVKRDGNTLLAELFLPRMNGGKGMHVLASASRLSDQEGNAIGAIQTMRDITDRKTVELALRESHTRLDAMANNVPGVVFQFYARPDGSLGFYYLSRRAAGALGIGPDTADPLGFVDRIHTDDRERFEASIRHAVQTGEDWGFEGRFISPTGETLWCQILSSPVPVGEELVFSGVVVDVTDRHQAMEEMRRAQLVAEAASQAQSRFLSNVSHEIRTPLNGIVGFAELIMNERDLDAVHTMAHTVLHESDILLSLVNELLDQARIESGRMDIESAATDMHDLVETVVKTIQMHAEKKGLQLEWEVAPEIPRFLMADRLRVCQVLLNLLNNSVKFTQQGVLALRLRVAGRDEGRLWIRFEVTDTGAGIPEDKRHLIFQRFAQVDAAASRKYGGTGLGLSVSKGLVDLMGGRIGFDSTVGVGSTFWFVLPLSMCGEPPASAHPETAPEKKPCDSYPVLLVEDYPPNQEVARVHLESAGYRVEVAANGIEAVRACESREFRLILMDVQMPEMDGFEATRLLRAKPGWTRDAVILGLTANADEKSRKDCLANGMDGVVTKPIRREAFLAEVARRLAGAPSEATRRPADAKVEGPPLPMDFDGAVQEFGGDRALLGGVVASFLDIARGQIAAMDGYIAACDAEAVRREAHKIKGAAANLTAMRLAEAARAIEQHRTLGDGSATEELFAGLKNELKSLGEFAAHRFPATLQG